MRLGFALLQRNMSEVLQKIGEYQLKRVPGDQDVQLKTFWENSDVVLYFLRRYGCPVCRWLAKNLSKLQPVFDQHNVKLVGIAPQRKGAEEFLEKKLFSGELIVDEEKKCYKDLQYSQYSFVGAMMALTDKDTRAINKKAQEEGLGGNIKGEFYQMGGLLILRKGGEILLNFKQQKGSDHVENKDVLKALGIDAPVEGDTDKPAECDAAACSI